VISLTIYNTLLYTSVLLYVYVDDILFDSGDGTLTCVNIKRRQMELQSELFDSEFLSLAIMKVRSILVGSHGDVFYNPTA